MLEPGYRYPEGRWFGNSAWGRVRVKKEIPNDAALTAYLEPQWRWIDALQNDFAARADWCVKAYKEANHPPRVVLGRALDIAARAGATVELSAAESSDPDGHHLSFRSWQYRDAGSYSRSVELKNAHGKAPALSIPKDAAKGQTIHLICEVTDSGAPPLTRYQCVSVTVTP